MAQQEIASTIPGVFYRRSKPGDPPLVNEGDKVEAGQTIGLIEIMKQFHEVKTNLTGVLTTFAVADQSEIEPGAAIAYVEVEQ